jgi:cytochrome c oxidase cbb3-type subunit 4
MNVHDVHGVLTILIIIAFIGLCAWVFSKKRDKAFEEAARLPLDDE